MIDNTIKSTDFRRIMEAATLELFEREHERRGDSFATKSDMANVRVEPLAFDSCLDGLSAYDLLRAAFDIFNRAASHERDVQYARDTNQPHWVAVANLGDVDIADHGGFIVYVDETGVYAPEVEYYDPFADEDYTGGVMYRFALDSVYNEHGDSAWWLDSLGRVAQSMGDGSTRETLLEDALSGDVYKLANVYYSLMQYHGADNFDSNPETLTEDEAQERYADIRL